MCEDCPFKKMNLDELKAEIDKAVINAVKRETKRRHTSKRGI